MKRLSYNTLEVRNMKNNNSYVSMENELCLQNALNVSLWELKVRALETIQAPNTKDLIIYVDKASKEAPTMERKEYVFPLEAVLQYQTKGDEFYQGIVIKDDEVFQEASVLRENQKEVLESMPIILFEGTNYIYTNYDNVLLSASYFENTEENKQYLNTATYANRKEEPNVLEGLITNTEDKTNLSVDNLQVTCITSKEHAFSLDQDGNLTVKSIHAFDHEDLDMKSIYDAIYPVGSIYLSVSNTNPSVLFGGTWEQITGYYLYAGEGGNVLGSLVSSGPSVNTTGSTALTVNQMPSHTHTQKAHKHAQHKDTWMNKTPIDKYVGSSSGFYAQSGTSTYYTDSTTAVNNSTGGGQGHTHTLNSHTHTIEPIRYELFTWKRVS